jgi:RNA polymerase sigma-70 factor (ECF subfamily)
MVAFPGLCRFLPAVSYIHEVMPMTDDLREMVLRRARSILSNDAAARDVMQDVFLTLHRDRETLDERFIDGWLYRVTTRRCFHVLRDAKNRARLLLERADHLISVQPIRAEEWSMVRRTLAALRDEVAAAAVYFHMDGMTYDEIAEVMQCSRRHVGNLLEELRATAAEQRSTA